MLFNTVGKGSGSESQRGSLDAGFQQDSSIAIMGFKFIFISVSIHVIMRVHMLQCEGGQRSTSDVPQALSTSLGVRVSHWLVTHGLEWTGC